MKNTKIYREIIIIISVSLLLSFFRYLFIYVDGICDSCSDENISQEFSIIGEVPLCVEDLYSASIVTEPTCVNFQTANFILEKKSAAVFIDARDSLFYSRGHIDGAINFPYDKYVVDGGLYLPYVRENIQFGETECYDELFCIGGTSDGKTAFISYPNTSQDKINEEIYYIVYCGSHKCDKSEKLSWFLSDSLKIDNILFYKGGFKEWEEMSNK